MRGVRFMSFPRTYTRQFYSTNPQVADLAYEDQKSALFDDGFSFSNSWERSLRSVASFQMFDVPYGVPELDHAYAIEYGVPGLTGMAVAEDIVRRLRPQVIFLSSLESWTPAQIDTLRAASSEVRAVVGMAGVDISHLPSLRSVDLLLTCMKGFAATLQAGGMDARVVAHAFDPRVLDRIGPARERSGFSFFGNVVSGPHYHDERARILEQLSARSGLVVYSNQVARSGQALYRWAKQQAAYRIGKLASLAPGMLDRLPHGAALRQAANWDSSPRLAVNLGRGRWKPAVYGLEMYEALASAQLTANIHIGAAGDFAANMRLFEATGVGTCLLTDVKSDLAEFFSPGVEVVAFDGLEDAVYKAKALLDDPGVALNIGLKGQERTLRDHTYDSRAPLVAEAFRDAVNRASKQK